MRVKNLSYRTRFDLLSDISQGLFIVVMIFNYLLIQNESSDCQAIENFSVDQLEEFSRFLVPSW